MQRAAGLSPIARLGVLFKAVRPLRLVHAHEREVLLVTTLGLAAFHWTALASFSPLDASPVVAVVPDLQPANLAGTLGAGLSGLALFAFGAVAWLLPVPFLSSAALIVRRRDAAVARSRILGWTLGFLSLAAFVALRRPYITWRGFDFPGGGIVGAMLAERLLLWFGRIGGLIAMATIGLCAPLMILRRSLLEPVATRAWTAAADWLKKAPSADDEVPTAPWWGRLWRRGQEPEVVGGGEGPAIDPVGTEDANGAGVFGGMPTPLAVAEPAGLRSPGGEVDEVDDVDDDEEVSAEADAIFARPAAAPRPRPTVAAYKAPPLSVFNKTDPNAAAPVNQKDLEATAALLVRTFEDFGVLGKIVGYQPGPVVTVFEFQPDAGVKQSKVVGLIDDLALALKVDSIFIHPVRGKRALGVQVPNTRRESVHLGDILATATFHDSASPLTFGMGKTINGQPMCADLTAMPHLLVAGATGSGKSVCINGMLCSIIMKAAPEEVRMILVDPKMLELSVYEGIPHLLMPVITEPTKASLALKWAVVEMERRYKLMQLACVRNIAGFNDYLGKISGDKKAELAAAVGIEAVTKLPYIILVIDELADLMMTAPKDVEGSIQRLAQKARASGIHMVLATQRPSVDIITGVIKANLPCRIAFQVVSKHDSRTILDLIGAEKLLGKGDMLLQRPGIGRLERLQGALITDDEVINLVAMVKAASPVHYDEKIISWIDDEYLRQKDGDGGELEIAMDDDPKWDEAITLARAQGVVSASFLQRHLKIGYNRAARIVEFMESQGLVDKADGAKPRKWLGSVA